MYPLSTLTVRLPVTTYGSCHKMLRAELRAYFDILPPRRVHVGRGAFGIDVRPNRAYWLPQVEEILADVGLNVETGQVAR